MLAQAWQYLSLIHILIAAQALLPDAQAVMAQLVKLNSTTMPMRYLWVFAAYIALRKQQKKFDTSYQMTKNQGLAYTAGTVSYTHLNEVNRSHASSNHRIDFLEVL